MWSRQVHALFDGYELSSYLDGSRPLPPPTITTDGVQTVNPEYTHRKRQDKLIYSSLLGAITTTIQPLLSRAETAAQIWEVLASIYAKPSRAHIKQIRQQLKDWKKGTKTIDEYVQGLVTRFDQLAILGKPLDHEDQVEFVVDGLPEEYKTVIDQIESKDVTPLINEIHERLLNQRSKRVWLVPQPRQSIDPWQTQLLSYDGSVLYYLNSISPSQRHL